MKILEDRKKNLKCHKCGGLGHMKSQCKASGTTTQDNIDDAKTTKTKTKIVEEDSVEELMKKLREMKNCKADVRAMAMEVAMASDDGRSEESKRNYREVQANTVVVGRL